MAFRILTPGVPSAKIGYGKVGTPAPVPRPWAGQVAAAGALVITPEALTGGNTRVYGSPGRLVAMPVPTLLNCEPQGSAPLESMQSGLNPPVVSNQFLVAFPSNAMVTPRIRPPKFIDPPITGVGTPSAQAAVFARGGKPRGVMVPQPWVTGAPQVITRWAVYGGGTS